MKLLSILLLLIFGCGKGANIQKIKVNKDGFLKIINQNTMPTNPNLSIDKSVSNSSYPIQIALYEDQNFYYDLPTLGDGKGKWTFKDGHLSLHAKRDLFDMYIEIHSLDEKVNDLVITFIDRHGHNLIRMDKHNIQD